MRDHIPLTITKFNGIFDRGFEDSTPADHFSDGRNFVFTQDGIQTRDGTNQSITLANIRRTSVYKRIGEASRLLILDNAGNLYDSLNLVTPILTIGAMTDFAMVPFFNRAYISPHNGTTGLSGVNVYVYDGTTIRQACGQAPSGTMNAAVSATVGNVEAGTHIFAVAFQTDTGFITKPGPTILPTVEAPGNRRITLTGIPTGPSETAKRVLLATRRISTYDGNQLGYEFFFIPDGEINNNVDTTLEVNFYDADLIESADYLFDQLERIPSGVNLTSYRSRLTVIGSQADPSVIRFSKTSDPESHDSISGFQVIDPTEAGGVKTGIEFRDSFYVAKSLRTYMIQGDESEPAFWRTIPIDKGIGSEPQGICAVLDSKGTNTDQFVAASRSGLVRFDGLYHQPELSWKINEIWKRINEPYFSKIQVACDSVQKLIYVTLPLDAATEISHLLVGNYENGLDAQAIRWSIWTFPWTIASISLDVTINQHPYLRIAGLAGNVYNSVVGLTDDEGQAIETYVKFAPLMIDDSGNIVHFAALRFRVRGSGNLQIALYSEDDVVTANPLSLTLSANPGRELTRICNFKNEKCSVRLRTNLFGEYFNLNKMTLYAAPLWTSRVS